MSTTKGFTSGFCTGELLFAAESADAKQMNDLLYHTARIFLSADINRSSMSMWHISDADPATNCADEAPESVRFQRHSPGNVDSELSCNDGLSDGLRDLQPAAMLMGARGIRSCQVSERGAQDYTYVLQIPHKMQSRIAIEFSIDPAFADSRHLVRMEYLVVIFYLAGLRLFEIIDRATARDWMTLVDGISPIQLMILREAVCAPRYNLTSMSDRLGIGKRGISAQLYRIHKFVEPKLPVFAVQDGNGSPLVDLIRAFCFLQFAGCPAPVVDDLDKSGTGFAASQRRVKTEGWSITALN